MLRSLASSSLRAAPRAGASAGRQQKRFLSIHEYQSMELLNKYDIPTPRSIPAKTPQEAAEAAKQFPNGFVIKAQVLAGGRGKGHFDSGLQGGVHLIKT